MELQRNAVKEVGQALEGRYPQYQRVMVEHTEAQGNPQFQWSFLVLFEKAAEILGTPKKSEIKAVLIPNGRNASARVVLPGHPYFNGVVMPIKASAVDAECPYLTYPEELEEESLV